MAGYEEDDYDEDVIGLGRKTQGLLDAAGLIAKERGHRAIGTGDLLWAMLDDTDASGSVALRFLEQRGVTKEALLENARYSDNAAVVLKLASKRAADEGKDIIGTEDILWAMFSSSHETSRSQAVAALEDRGVNFDMVFGRAILSENAKIAFREAIKNAQRKQHEFVGSEDLLWALFQKTKVDSRARSSDGAVPTISSDNSNN